MTLVASTIAPNIFDFSQPEDARPKMHQPTRAVGEFEIPILETGNSQNRDLAQVKTNTAKQRTATEYVSFGTNIFSCICNGLAFVSEVLPFMKGLKPSAAKLANLGTNIFLTANSVINTVNRFKDRNLLSMMGYLNDLYVGLFVPHRKKYLSRGPSVGFSQMANVINNLNKKHKFASFTEHLEYVKAGFLKAMGNFRNPIANLSKKDNAMSGFVGTILSIAGTILWKVTGSEKLGACVRDFGGGLLDIEQVMPYQWLAKRKLYISSGISYIIGTAFDLLSKFSPQLEPPLRYLCFIADCIGKDLQRQSEDRGEMSFAANLQASGEKLKLLAT